MNGVDPCELLTPSDEKYLNNLLKPTENEKKV